MPPSVRGAPAAERFSSGQRFCRWCLACSSSSTPRILQARRGPERSTGCAVDSRRWSRSRVRRQHASPGPSYFLGRCPYGDRLAEMAALALAIVLVGILAALKTPGWRVAARSAGASAVILGLLSIVLPGAPGALSQAWGALAATWGVLFAVAAEWEARLGMPSAGRGKRTI